MVSNIDFIAGRPGSRENDCKVKEASWVSSQAWFEGLRYYPSDDEASEGGDSQTFSGNTHGEVTGRHLETNVRTRLGMGRADADWRDDQLQLMWRVPQATPKPARRRPKGSESKRGERTV